MQTLLKIMILFACAQIFIHSRSCAAAFGNSPHHQALPATGIAGGEDAGHAGPVVLVAGSNGAASIFLYRQSP